MFSFGNSCAYDRFLILELEIFAFLITHGSLYYALNVDLEQSGTLRIQIRMFKHYKYLQLFIFVAC